LAGIHNNTPSVQRLEISLKITEKILVTSDREWWDNLELNWKIIFLSNYCFNRIGWNIIDCDIECFMPLGNLQHDLIDFADWAGGRDFDFAKNMESISSSVLNSIICDTKMLWCSGASVSTILPLFRIISLKDCKDITCKLSINDIIKIKGMLDYFKGYDPYTRTNYEIGRKKTWEEYKENKKGL
jgi:hypothetical protein